MEPAHVRQGALDLRRTAISSAVMATAISSGVIAPISRPTGACTRSNRCLGNAFFDQFAEDGNRLALRSNHADVACLGLHRPAQHAHVVAMAAGDDHDERSFIRRSDPRHGLVEVFGDDFFGFGKALAVGVALAIVDDGDVKAGISGGFIKTEGHVTCAENIK